MLIYAMLGVNTRATVDMDVTIKGLELNFLEKFNQIQPNLMISIVKNVAL